MCFSAPVSFAAAAALSGLGVVTLRMTERPAELPFAGIPLLFGIQQLSEGLLWLSLRAEPPWPSEPLVLIYSLFSHVLWPIYVPFAVGLLETVPWRRRLLAAFQLGGLGIGLYLLDNLFRYPVTAKILGGHIAYDSPHFYVGTVVSLYLLSTCCSSLASGHRTVRLFGAATFLASVAAYAIHAATWISVWCFFAAVLSAVVALHFLAARRQRREADAGARP